MKRVFVKLLAVCSLYLAAAPAFILVSAWVLPERTALGLIAPALGALAGALAGLMPKKARVPALIPLALAAALGVFMLYREAWPLSLIPAALSIVPAVLMAPAMARAPAEEWTPSLWFWGAGAHLVSRFLIRITPELSPATVYLRWLLIPLVFAMVLYLNRAAVTEGLGGSKPPRRIMRRNTIGALLIAALSVLAANLQAVIDAVNAAIDFLRRAFAAFVNWLMSLNPAEMSEQGAPAQENGFDMGALGETAQTSPFWRIMEAVFKYVALALLLAAVIFVLIKLWKYIKRAFKRLLERLRAYASRVGESYEDTVESVLDWGEVASAIREKARSLTARRVKPLPWSRLDPRQQVRRAFSVARARTSAAPSKTAREVLQGESLPVPREAASRLADLYDKARYSDQPVDEGEARYMRDKVGC